MKPFECSIQLILGTPIICNECIFVHFALCALRKAIIDLFFGTTSDENKNATYFYRSMSQRYVFTSFRGTVESRQTLSIFHIKWLDSVNSVYCIAEYSLVQTNNAQDNSVCMLAER